MRGENEGTSGHDKEDTFFPSEARTEAESGIWRESVAYSSAREM